MSELSELVERLKRQRDELGLQIHLGTMEAKQEWNALETKWEEFVAKADLEQSAEGVGGAVKLLGNELKRGYERIKKAL